MDIRDLTARVQDLKARMIEIQNVLDVTANIRMREFIERISEVEAILQGQPVTPASLRDDAGRTQFTDDRGNKEFKGD